jgi:hypothetical protein
MIDALRQQQAHYMGQTHLDGVRVFEVGQRYLSTLLLKVGVDPQLLLAVLVVEVTELPAEHGRGSALRSVDLNVAAASDGFGVEGHFGLLGAFMKCMKLLLTPTPLRGSGIMGLGGEKLSKYGLQGGYR